MAIQPTLAMIPSGYKDGKLYSVLPTDGVGDFDVTRGSDATRINKDGLIETVSNNVPRLDYTGGGCPSLLLEPQSTNLYLFSAPTVNEGVAGDITYESFSWSNGFTNCVKFGDNSAIRYRYGSTVSINTEYTISFFVIMDDLSIPIASLSSSTGDFAISVGGTISGGVINTNVNLGNNIYRVSKTVTTSGTVNATNNGVIKYTGQSSKGFRVVGAQLEQSPYASSLIPTNGSTVTRLAETATGSGDASTFNDSEGVLFAEMAALANDLTFRYIVLSDGTNNNRIVLRYNNTSNQISTLIVVGGATPYILSFAVTDITQIHKIAFKWKVNNFALFIDGIKVATLLTAITFPSNTLNTFSLKSPVTSTENLEAKVKDLRVYNTALTDLEIETLTSFTSFNEMALNFNYTI